jgi:drug/metabolite transporter (DMT)-like permease
MQTNNTIKAERQAHAGLLISALIVGISFPAVGQITEGLPPLSLTAVRFAIAALAVWPLVRRLPGLWPGSRGLALYGVLGLCLASFFGAMFWAAHHASALSMAGMYVSVPAIAYMLGRLLRVEQHSPRLIAILLTGAAGALALIWAESRTTSETFALGYGETVFLLACVGAASFPVLSKFGLQRGYLSPRAEIRTFWSLLIGSCAIASIALFTENPAELVSMNTRDFLIVTYLATFSSAFTFWLSQRATAVLTPGAITAYSYTAPFVSMLLLFISEPQQMGLRWLPGSLLVTLAIALLLSLDRPRRQITARDTQPPVPGAKTGAAYCN